MVDAVLPPRCLACGEGLGGPGALCSSCWSGIDYIAGPVCACCGLPFEFDEGGEVLCGNCLRLPPAFQRARSVMRYNDASKGLVLAFKHGDRTDGAPTYGSWLARAGAELLDEIDLIVPVPLHQRRLFARRYNQSALLAQALGRECGVEAAVDLLRRTKATPSLGGLSAIARHNAVRGAFKVSERWKPVLRGARLLLIDDVFTTGATVDACAKTLVRVGASSVDVLTLARVVRPSVV